MEISLFSTVNAAKRTINRTFRGARTVKDAWVAWQRMDTAAGSGLPRVGGY
mgnify:FL=1